MNFDLNKVVQASSLLKNVVKHTPLEYSESLSEEFQAEVWLKREDMQLVRSYKLRGAYFAISTLKEQTHADTFICASAGNHAQGVAFSCRKLDVKGIIYMPVTTPEQKVQQVKWFGKDSVEVRLVGDTFDDAFLAAKSESKSGNIPFVHPFDDELIISGQGTVGLEILEDMKDPIDLLVLPVGGGGLASGTGSVFKNLSPKTHIVGAQPAGAPSMIESFKVGQPLTLPSIEKFVDGAAVKRPGDLTFHLCRQVLDDLVAVDEGKICSTIVRLYTRNAIVAEPAGALALAALDQKRELIKGKRVVVVISGGNNDISRMEEIKERALASEGKKHFFYVDFAQRAGALKEFLINVLGDKNDIVFFQYTKLNNREKAPVYLGIELAEPTELPHLIQRMEGAGLSFRKVEHTGDLTLNIT